MGQFAATDRELATGEVLTVAISLLFLVGVILMTRMFQEIQRDRNALLESEEKYRTLVEKSNEGIVIAQDNVLVYANPKILDILSVEAEDLLGKSFSDFIYQDDRAMVMERYRQRLRGAVLPDSYEFRVITRDNQIKWMYITAKQIQWKERPATLNMLTDVTKRHQAELELMQSEENYRGIIENVIDVYYRSDAQGNVIMISPSALSVLGYDDLNE
jgi:PAS domain S-box-containing protein